jgi:hypothetical protein
MAKPWTFYFKVRRWHIVFCDDLNMYSMTIPKWWHQLPRHCWCHHHVSCHIIVDVTSTSAASMAYGGIWPKHRNICDQIESSHNTNAVNSTVSTHDRWEIMTKMGFHPWPTTFVIDWIQFHDVTQVVIEWRHIFDENYHFVTNDKMWHDHSEEIQIVTNSLQMNINDDSAVFSDVRWTSSMPTSLLVCQCMEGKGEKFYRLWLVAAVVFLMLFLKHLFMCFLWICDCKSYLCCEWDEMRWVRYYESYEYSFSDLWMRMRWDEMRWDEMRKEKER